MSVEVTTKNEGAPRAIEHAIRVAPTDVVLPLKPDGTRPVRRMPPVIVYPAGTVWVDPALRREAR